MDELQPRRPSLTARIGLALRPKKSSRSLRKPSVPEVKVQSPPPVPPVPTGKRLQKRLQHGAIYRPANDNRDEQTGERRDDTDLLHGLAHLESDDSLDRTAKLKPEDVWRPPGDHLIDNLPTPLWELIASYLPLSDVVALTLSNKSLLRKFTNEPWFALNEPQNLSEKNAFLQRMDENLPAHLHCFDCGIYHLRTQLGSERLRPTLVFNPLFDCPSITKPNYVPPRLRITPGNTLPYAFVQLVFRDNKYSPNHGIPLTSLSRRWKDPESEWTHQTRNYFHKGHLLMRVVSQSFAAPKLPPSGQRHLLYSREDYSPYFSCCAHWRDGELMNICKCALEHIPEPQQSIRTQLKSGPQISMGLRNVNMLVTLCSFCRSMRRCPKCPTEYLVELKLAEDKLDPVQKFKQAITVTRWSDLGDGTSPYTPEWTSVNGISEYKSFEVMGKRAISGVFEAQSGVTMPGQRLLNLNPKKVKLEEDDSGWY